MPFCPRILNLWKKITYASRYLLNAKAFAVLQARVLATIGVTRGLGDHELKVHDSNIYIKPFLSCCPEVSSVPARSEQSIVRK